ncbi:hypothetical protein HETIRDRAFT_246944, partial [Heterobasidion irregulare TC 32-1]
PRPRSPSPPSQTHHHTHFLHAVPTPALLQSVAGAAHYSGVDPVKERSIATRRMNSLEHDRGRAGPKRHSSAADEGADHRAVVDDLKELYECRPTTEILERRWRRDASFEVCRTNSPMRLARTQTRIMSSSTTLGRRVLASTDSPNRVIFWQKQEYVVRITGSKKSIVVVDLDEAEKIIRVVDQWHGKDLPTRWGAHFFRRLNAKVVPWV